MESCFAAGEGETLSEVLLRNDIPPASVVALSGGLPILETYRLQHGDQIDVHLIEGYDIGAIRAFRAESWSHEPINSAAYLKRRLMFGSDGCPNTESVPMSLPELAEYVDATILETCREFELLPTGSTVLVGLSGGVDSSSLLLALDKAAKSLDGVRVVACTFEDFDSVASPTFHHAKELAASLAIEHTLVPADQLERAFKLRKSLRSILPELMHTESAASAMYVDHHTTRRALEIFAENSGISTIALGLHTTDLLAGLLNGWFTGYNVAGLPKRAIGPFSYIYPLAFLPKRELHLYHLHRTGHLARHSYPNAWERNPIDRNFYYYMADYLQSLWPGLEVMAFTAHEQRQRRLPPLDFEVCTNCRSHILQQPMTITDSSECDVCQVLRKHGYIED